MINIIILVEHLIESVQDFVFLGKNFQHIMYVLMFYQFFSFLPHFTILKLNKQNNYQKQLIEWTSYTYLFVEKITPKELDADYNFISQCQYYLEKSGQTLAMFGKLGSGKRTLAAQVAIRIAKKNPEMKFKIVTERDTITKDLESRHSTILIIHDPVKSWYTDRYTEYIIYILSRICTSAKNKDNNLYVIAIFHCNDWNSLHFGKKKLTMEKLFPKREPIYGKKLSVKLSYRVKDNQEDISYVPFQKWKKSTEESFELTLFFKNLAFQHDVLDNPIMSIIAALKTLERSNKNHEQLAFKLMAIVMLHGGEIAKRELLADDIPNHEAFADLKEKMDVKGSIMGCINQLLEIFLEETENGRSYRILHDVITRCTFIVAFENHRTLLFKKCDAILVFECLRQKSLTERFPFSDNPIYDYSNLKILLSSKLLVEMARLFFQRKDMRSVLRNSRIYNENKFQNEWSKLELHYTNAIPVINETDN